MTQFAPTVVTESEPVIVQQMEESGETVQGLVENLIDYASFLHQLYAQAHLIHLNIVFNNVRVNKNIPAKKRKSSLASN
jgi:hypothetical protein